MSQEIINQKMSRYSNNMGSMNEPQDSFNEIESYLLKPAAIATDKEHETSGQEVVEDLLKVFTEDAQEQAGWQSHSHFSVEFKGTFEVEVQTRHSNGYTAQRLTLRNLKTTAKHMLDHQFKSEISPMLAGMTEHEVQQWIFDRMQTNLQLESLVMESPILAAPIALEITQLRIVQSSNPTLPLIANPTNPLFPDGILADRSFNLEVTIAMPETAIADLQNQLMILSATCEARHLTTGAVTQWGETRMNVMGGARSTFTLVMRDLLVSELGGYRLRVFATIQNLAATEAVFKVPVLEVESPNPPSCSI